MGATTRIGQISKGPTTGFCGLSSSVGDGDGGFESPTTKDD
jgi:hypothetical protein